MPIPQNNKSFTLIEILVTIVIIGILAGVIMISTSSSIDKTKDAIRRNDLGMISRGLRAYKSTHGSYPVLSCKIGTAGCLDILVPEYFSMLPIDPVSGYYGYSSTGSEFMIVAGGSDELINYTDSNGFDGSLIARVSPPYILKPRLFVGGAYYEGASINDASSLWGNVVTASNVGWNGFLLMTLSEGFEIGVYDVYLRIRANNVTSMQVGIYNETTTTYPLPQKWITGITSSYQIKKIATIEINEFNVNDRKRLYFAGGGEWFVDYVEFRKVN